jgi:hypothetical protein
MAHNCAVLRIDVLGALALYRCRDSNELTFLDQVVEAVSETRRQEKERMDREMAKAKAKAR